MNTQPLLRLPLLVRPFSFTLQAKSTKVYVGSLSWNVDDARLQEEFADCGEITSVKVITDRYSGNSRGFGFVEFADAETASKAIQDMDGKEIDGRSIQVDLAQDRDTERGGGRAGTDKLSPPSLTVFVGNLSYNTTQDDLRNIFQEFGEIKSVRIPVDRDNGGGKGFGYVEFAEQDDATKALESLQLHLLGGRKMRLDYSQPRVDRETYNNNGDRGSPYVRGGGGGRGRDGYDNRGGGRGDRGGGGYSRGSRSE